MKIIFLERFFQFSQKVFRNFITEWGAGGSRWSGANFVENKNVHVIVYYRRERMEKSVVLKSLQINFSVRTENVDVTILDVGLIAHVIAKHRRVKLVDSKIRCKNVRFTFFQSDVRSWVGDAAREPRLLESPLRTKRAPAYMRGAS